MIEVRVGAGRAARTPDETVRFGDAVTALLTNGTMQELLDATAAGCVTEWERAPTAEAREAAFHRLQGLKALVKEMNKAVDAATFIRRTT